MYLLIIILIVDSFSAPSMSTEMLQKRDTLISINNNTKLRYDTFNPMLGLWFNPVLLQQGKILKITDYNYVNGSELSIRISPNKKFVLFDEISKGYVLISESDSVLQENVFCSVVDLEVASIVYRSQSDCSGEWNSKSQLVSGGTVLFSPSSVDLKKNSSDLSKANSTDKVDICKTYFEETGIHVDGANIVFINDCAFYLQKSGQNTLAIAILNEVVSKFPFRTPAYLNLADAYKGIGNLFDAKQNYQKYIELMKLDGKEKKIPVRVLKAVVIPSP